MGTGLEESEPRRARHCYPHRHPVEQRRTRDGMVKGRRLRLQTNGLHVSTRNRIGSPCLSDRERRPEASSRIGETVKLAKSFLAKLSPACHSGLWKTPL